MARGLFRIVELEQDAYLVEPTNPFLPSVIVESDGQVLAWDNLSGGWTRDLGKSPNQSRGMLDALTFILE